MSIVKMPNLKKVRCQVAQVDWEPYLKDVQPDTLKNPIWLKRDSLKDVIFDLLKGDISCPYWFVRSHTLMFIQTLVFSMIWIVLGAAIVSGVSRMIFDKDTIFVGAFGRAELGGYLAASSAIYWNIAKRYGDQWTYCAGVFNRIFYDKFPAERPLEHLYRKATFAIDLIDCNLWHHRSFVTDFNFILECAVHYRRRSGMDISEEIAKYGSKKMRVSDARTAIAEFQNALEKHLQHLALLNEVARPPSAPPQPDSMENGGFSGEEPKAGAL